MATKFSALPAASSITTDDLIPIVDMAGPTTQKATIAQLKAAIGFTPPTGSGLVTVSGGALNPAASALDANIAAFLATPTSANLAAALSDESGSGACVFGTSPLFKGTPGLNNPANTFKYVFTPSAITADRVITVPLLTAADTLVLAAFIQTLTNKTLVAASNTITDTSAVTGDLFRYNGTRFVRFARGTALQILRTNSAGTDIEWATAAGGSPGGSDTFVQFNDGGVFGGDAGLTYTKGTQRLEVMNLRVDGQFANSANNYLDNATLQTGDLLEISQALTADFSNSTTTFASTNLAFTMAANEVWIAEWDGGMLAGAVTTGMALAIVAPAGATIAGEAIGSTTSLAILNSALVTALSPTSFATLANASAVNGVFRVRVTITNGATAGTVALQMKSGTSGTAMKILAGSRLSACRCVKV